jgi:transcription antitermination factor NusG
MKRWFVVYTKPRWEKKVHNLFYERGIENYCPLNKVRKRWSDRMKTVEEPLFKSYVFVKVTLEDQTKVRMVNGVINFVYWLGKPAIVKEKEIELIQRFLNEYKEVQAEPLFIRPDMKVKIQSGALMEHEATVIETINKNKIKVIIESIGYALTAVVDKSNVEIVEK